MSGERKRYLVGMALGTMALALPHSFDRKNEISLSDLDMDYKPHIIHEPDHVLVDPPTFEGEILFTHASEARLQNAHHIKRIDGPLILKTEPKRNSRKFDIDLYQVAEIPDTHLHIRYVDHNEIGYGGGLKIALEIVEEF